MVMGEWTCEGEVTPWRQDDGTQLREPMRCQARCDVKLLNLMRLSVCLSRSTGRSRDVKWDSRRWQVSPSEQKASIERLSQRKLKTPVVLGFLEKDELCCRFCAVFLIHLISFKAKRFKEQTCLKSVCFCNSYLEHRLTAIYYPGHWKFLWSSTLLREVAAVASPKRKIDRQRSGGRFSMIQCFGIPKFNIGSEKWWFEDDFPFGMAYFQGLC